MDASRRKVGVVKSRERRNVAIPPLGWAPPVHGGAAMGCVAMMVGIGLWILFWFGDATPPEGLRKWGSAAFALLFFLFGLLFVSQGVHPPHWWRMRHFRGGKESWGEGYRWSQEMKPLAVPGGGCIKSCIGLLALTVFAGVINMVWLDTDAIRGAKWLAYILIPLFTLLILFIIGSAIVEGVKQFRFGTARLYIENYPTAPGRKLCLEFRTGGRLDSSKEANATLACLDQSPLGKDLAEKGTAPRIEVVYSQKRILTIAENLVSPGRLRMDFDLPDDVASTLLQRPDGGRTFWRLDVATPMTNRLRRQSFTFLLPIYSKKTSLEP